MNKGGGAGGGNKGKSALTVEMISQMEAAWHEVSSAYCVGICTITLI